MKGTSGRLDLQSDMVDSMLVKALGELDRKEKM